MKNWSRRAKIIFWLVFIAILCMIMDVQSYIPSATAKQAFRRQEKAELLGPAEILTELDFAYGYYDGTVLGKSDYGYTFYGWMGNDYGDMVFLEKQGDAVLYIPDCGDSATHVSAQWQYPVFLFTELPSASRAELQLTLTYKGETETISLGADIQEGGYGIFWLTQDNTSRDTIKNLMFTVDASYIVDGTLTGTATLYDGWDNEIGSEAEDFTRNKK